MLLFLVVGLLREMNARVGVFRGREAVADLKAEYSLFPYDPESSYLRERRPILSDYSSRSIICRTYLSSYEQYNCYTALLSPWR